MRLSPCVLVQPDGWALGEREGYGGPRDVIPRATSMSPEDGVIITRYYGQFALARRRRDREEGVGLAHCVVLLRWVFLFDRQF